VSRVLVVWCPDWPVVAALAETEGATVPGQVPAPAAVLTRSAPKDIFAEPACRDLARAAATEGAAIAAALGCTLQQDINAQLAAGQALAHQPSVLQELEAGRKMEAATLFEAPLALARQAGIPTPTLDLLTALVRQRARAAGL